MCRSWSHGGLDSSSLQDNAPQFHVTSDNVCIVCAARPINVCLRPCNHVALCGQCADQLRPPLCPVCRAPIASITRSSLEASAPQSGAPPAREPIIASPTSEP